MQEKTVRKGQLLKNKCGDIHGVVFFFYEKDDYMTKKS